jgi:pimeloyl-ACP methyl ester carboxylesterase
MMQSTRPVLVLLPGTLCDARVFDAIKRKLRAQMQVLCINYAHMKNVHHWLASLLKQLPPTFHVAGFSLGGLLALELVRLAPERVQGIALIASNAQAASYRAQRKSAWLRRMWLARGAGLVAQHVKPAYFHHEAKRRQHERLVYDMALRTPQRSAFEEFAWAAKRPSSLPTLQDFAGSMLAISGEKDRLCPPAWQRAMQAAQPRMQWHEIERCGHFVPLEAPARLSHCLTHWIFQSNQPLAGIEYARPAINLGVSS